MKNLTILISSYDKSHDFWHITAESFNKNWPDNPYEIILGANGKNHINSCPSGWKYLNKGADKSWHLSMIDYLSEVTTKYVLVHLDDFALIDKVSTNKINKCINFLEKENGVYLRLLPKPKPEIEIDDCFGAIAVSHNVPYITSLQPSIWNKNFLIELLKYKFNPWEFETKGGKTDLAINNKDAFYGVYKPIIDARHFVEKGKFLPYVKNLISSEEFNTLIDSRGIWEKDAVNDTFYSRIFNLIPNKYQNIVRKMFGMSDL